MTADDLAAELNRDPFHPVRLHLTDGDEIDLPTPYLSFILKQHLYCARATRARGRDAQVELIPVAHIQNIDRPVCTH